MSDGITDMMRERQIDLPSDNRKIYICGKITGIEDEARVQFEKIEAILVQRGFEVVNPFKLEHKHDKSWQAFMKVCIKALCDCQCIYLLDNFQESKGASLELRIAIMLNMIIVTGLPDDSLLSIGLIDDSMLSIERSLKQLTIKAMPHLIDPVLEYKKIGHQRMPSRPLFKQKRRS